MGVPSRGPELQAVCYTLVTTAIISTLLRCYVRVRMVKNFGFDDYCMCAALCSFILFVTSALIGVHYGTGRHHKDLADDDIKEALKWWWWCYMWYCLTMIASKISIGYFLLRITARKLHVWIIYGVMMMTVMTGIVFFFVTLFQCQPISFFWNKDQKGTCVPVDVIIALTYLYSACSVISDFTCAILPMFLVWKLNMGKKTKLALIPIMGMACVASSAVVVRFAFVKDFKSPDFLSPSWSCPLSHFPTHTPSTAPANPTSGATVDIAIWSTTEQGLAVTAGSLATLRPLLRLLGHKLGISTFGPSVLQDTDQPIASGGYLNSKNTDRSGGGNKHRSLFSLTTFTRQDDLDGHGRDGQAAYAGEHHHDRPTSVGKGPSVWRSRREAENASEEELTGMGQQHNKGVSGDPQRIVKVTTFRMHEDRV
ncbi:integral membrane PTH11 [Fusarium albosuccineum]|uniref:Integral membrane PTH11 n=1 Tax=Fusarium albosuccineum TaxID=1237068 RepID=A0A8H4L288_9HYPO|nr:integral membrane PTH11 [Fusarium albosuccineum]